MGSLSDKELEVSTWGQLEVSTWGQLEVITKDVNRVLVSTVNSIAISAVIGQGTFQNDADEVIFCIV